MNDAVAPINPRAERLTLAARAGWMLVLFLTAFAALAPILVAADPVEQDLMAVLEAPGRAHLLGTDEVGRDVLARVAYGAHRSMGLALLCVALAAGIGTGIGLVAAYSGRIGEALLMRLADLLLAFPGILLTLLLTGFLGGGAIPIMAGLTLTLWPQFARLARAVAGGVLVETHVEAAELAGFSRSTILRRHVLPFVSRQVVALATLSVGRAIIAVSSLGFLGLGLQPPTPEWGAMISEGLPTIGEAPWAVAAPCLAIVACVFGLTLLGDSLANGLGHEVRGE